MYLARVIGNVVATQKVPGLEGIRLLLVQPLDEAGRDRGKPVAAADVTQAGPGDLVHVTTSREAAIAMPDPFVPVDAAIIAIVDHVHIETHAHVAHEHKSYAELDSTVVPPAVKAPKKKGAA